MDVQYLKHASAYKSRHLRNRESIANSQPFAQRGRERPTEFWQEFRPEVRSIKMIRTAAFLRALAAAKPPKPPPTITTQGTFAGVAYSISLVSSNSECM